jgi:hypothetical protein
MLEKSDATAGRALWLLTARVVQSIIHLISTSAIAVRVRFTAFVAQMAIGLYWTIALI